jgi:hypothetical protein
VTDWGPLATPFHTGVDTTAAPWRENAFLAFFDPTRSVCGAIHCSTSPNAPGRARASVVVDGRLAEVVEPLDPLTFTGAAIDYALPGTVTVRHAALALELRATPRFVPADYTRLGLIPPLPGHEPLSHYQQGADVTGWVELDGERTTIEARGFRDRTWGFRDESAMFVEYLAFGACFDDFDLTLTKFLDPDGGMRTGGYRLTKDVERVEGVDVTRSAAGLLAAIDVRLERGDELSIRVGSSTGFWAPMGIERRGPTLAAYEECVTVDAGEAGRGTAVVEHGILRRLY